MSLLLLLVPLIGISFVTIEANYGLSLVNNIKVKSIALITSIINLVISLIMFILFDFSSKSFQFIEEHYQISYFDIYLGVDGLSIYFLLLITIIVMSSIMGTTDFDALSKANFSYVTQLFLFYGIFIAFAVKTPVIFLNT